MKVDLLDSVKYQAEVHDFGLKSNETNRKIKELTTGYSTLQPEVFFIVIWWIEQSFIYNCRV